MPHGSVEICLVCPWIILSLALDQTIEETEKTEKHIIESLIKALEEIKS